MVTHTMGHDDRERFLVTGSMGCLGAWTIRTLLDEGVPVVALDWSPDTRRLRLLLSEEELAAVQVVTGDITDPDSVWHVVSSSGVTNVLHLAALQIPFCRADPVMGARVNMVGTVNVFEAVRRAAGQVTGLAYASSAAVFGGPELYPGGTAGDHSPVAPTTLYGAYKVANEHTAHVYALESSIGSVGLRPCVVYGVARDQGLTSAPTTAMLAAAAGQSYHIGFGGSSTFQLAADVARVFVAAARIRTDEAHVLNVGGPTAPMVDLVAAIEAATPNGGGRLSFDDVPLPVPSLVGEGLDRLIGTVAYTSLAEGVADTMDRFRDLLSRGLIAPPGSAPA
jgi:UDP-glucuronate 4-epimerase